MKRFCQIRIDSRFLSAVVSLACDGLLRNEQNPSLSFPSTCFYCALNHAVFDIGLCLVTSLNPSHVCEHSHSWDLEQCVGFSLKLSEAVKRGFNELAIIHAKLLHWSYRETKTTENDNNSGRFIIISKMISVHKKITEKEKQSFSNASNITVCLTSFWTVPSVQTERTFVHLDTGCWDPCCSSPAR